MDKKHIQLNEKIVELIEQNPKLLLMLQYLNVNFCVGDKKLKDIAEEKGISDYLLLAIANLYCGTIPNENPIKKRKDIKDTVEFLKNSHYYYREEKYPEILGFIKELQKRHPNKEIMLLEKFFIDYFQEVKEHLNYEDNVAFPYFLQLIRKNTDTTASDYTSRDYSEHHTDIELKLKDFKTLLLKHINIKDDYELRKKLLFAVFELSNDLYIHSLIEDTVLIPGGKLMEKEDYADIQ